MWVKGCPKRSSIPADCAAWMIQSRASRTFVSVTSVGNRLRRVITRALPAVLAMVGATTLLGCGDHGLFPSTVDPGADFSIADVVFDDKYFYCKVEPVLFANGCGSGNATDPKGGCHFSATAYRLTSYTPLVGDSCGGGLVPSASIPQAAQANYQTSQARMKRDPDLAPLLQRPTGNQAHPRQVIDITSADADAIRQWATQFSNQ